MKITLKKKENHAEYKLCPPLHFRLQKEGINKPCKTTEFGLQALFCLPALHFLAVGSWASHLTFLSPSPHLIMIEISVCCECDLSDTLNVLVFIKHYSSIKW